jgi:hypothetical protein
MLHLLLAGTSALALLAGTAAANADIFGFMPETVQSFTVMTSGTYDIIAAGRTAFISFPACRARDRPRSRRCGARTRAFGRDDQPGRQPIQRHAARDQPPELFQRYEALAFWQDPAQLPKAVRMV